MITHKEYLERNAEWRRDRSALRIAETGESVTWEAFDERANRFGNALADRGIRKGDRVAVVLYNTVEFPVAVYGCYKVGAVPVPLNYMLTRGDFAYIFDDTNPQFVVYDAGVGEAVEGAADDARRRADLIRVGDEGEAGESIEAYDQLLESGAARRPDDYPLHADETVYILYTSGTTGNPKGVTFTAETADRRGIEMASMTNLTQDSTALQLSPWFHAGGIDNTVHPSVTGGAELVVQDDFGPEPALESIESYAVTHISSVPTLTKRIAETEGVDDRNLSSIECWINMGSPLSQRNAETFLETLTPNVYNNYGTTETLTDTVLRPEDLPEKAGTVGRPNIDKRVRTIRTDRGRRVDPDETVPVGEKGQVVVSGDTLFDGYFGNAEATKRACNDGWFYTKDVGVIDEDGYLTITGRADDMINSGGELVSPVEVEDALESHDGVEAAIVVGVPDEEWGERVKAIVVADEGTDEETLVEYCKASGRLAGYKRPRRWEFTDELERTATGKKQRFKYRPD